MFGAGGNNVELVQLLIDAGAKVTDVVEGAPEYLDKLASQVSRLRKYNGRRMLDG